jgi:hypothetical protein
MHDLLFQNSKEWGKLGPNPETAASVRATFAGYATKLGLDVARFQRDMDGEEVRARITLDQERAASIGVDRTPFLFLDGVQIPFALLDEKELRGVIDAALSGKPMPPAPSPTPQPPPPPISTSALPQTAASAPPN